jgi:hypothetical protein
LLDAVDAGIQVSGKIPNQNSLNTQRSPFPKQGKKTTSRQTEKKK